MRPRLLLVSDGLEAMVPHLTRVLREAGLGAITISHEDLETASPADLVLLRVLELDAVAACWRIHRQGHRWIVALDPYPNPDDCIRLLNGGADGYMLAFPGPELIARLRSFLRLRAWAELETDASLERPTAREYAQQ